MPSKLKPLLFLALAGGAAVVLRKRAGGQDAEPDTAPRYAAPAEAGAQPAGGDPNATVVRDVPAEAIKTKAHDLPADTVMPDVSADDPSVREAEGAAASDAAAIGEKTDESSP